MNKQEKKQLKFRYYSGWIFMCVFILGLAILNISDVDGSKIKELSLTTRLFFFTVFSSLALFVVGFYIPKGEELKEALKK